MATIETLFNLPTDGPFDYQLAMERLRDFRAPRDKLRQLCERGEVVRVKKGLYVPGWHRDQEMPVDPLVLAGLVYGPSYVSLETALSHYGMIPERVEEITCVTTKRARRFRTPLGRFSYRPVNEHAFSYAVRLEQARGGTYFLAEPEKALCDRIALVRGLSAMRDVPALLEEDLRLDLAVVRRDFRLPVVMEIARRYRRQNVRMFAQWLGRESKAIAS